MLRKILLTSLFVAAAASAANAGPKTSLSAAMATCDRRAAFFGRSINGRGGETPSGDQIGQFYRSCVHAKSGRYPTARKRKNGVTISGNVGLGLRYKKKY